jgi:hypothetical protein
MWLELNQALAEGKPLADSRRDDVFRNIHHQNSRTALIWELRSFAAGILLRLARWEWASFDAHREPIAPRSFSTAGRRNVGALPRNV